MSAKIISLAVLGSGDRQVQSGIRLEIVVRRGLVVLELTHPDGNVHCVGLDPEQARELSADLDERAADADDWFALSRAAQQPEGK